MPSNQEHRQCIFVALGRVKNIDRNELSSLLIRTLTRTLSRCGTHTISNLSKFIKHILNLNKCSCKCFFKLKIFCTFSGCTAVVCGCVYYKAPAVQHVAPSCLPLSPAVTLLSLNSTRLMPHTEVVIASYRVTLASWPSRSQTRSTLRSRKTTSGVKELISEQNNEESFPPLTPPTSAYLTTVRFENYRHCYFFYYLD